MQQINKIFTVLILPSATITKIPYEDADGATTIKAELIN